MCSSSGTAVSPGVMLQISLALLIRVLHVANRLFFTWSSLVYTTCTNTQTHVLTVGNSSVDEEFLIKRRYESMLLLATLKCIVLSRNIQVANLNNKTVTTNLNKSSQLLNKEYEKIDYYFFIQKFVAGKIFKYC